MEDRWSRSGRKVVLYLTNGEAIVGWILAVDVRQLLISLDKEKENIRLIQKHQIMNVDLDLNRDQWIEPIVGKKRLARLQQFDEEVGVEARNAMDILYTRRLCRLALKYRELSISGKQQKNDTNSCSEEVLYSLLASTELLDELERSRLLPFVREHSKLLSEIVHEETLPGGDADWADRHEISRLIIDAQERPAAILELNRSLIEKAQHTTWSRRDNARWTDGVSDVVLGGGFAAANATLGVVAGVFSSLPTLGIGTVAATVGVLTSTYTGLTRLKDGLVTLIHGPSDSEKKGN